MYKGIKLSKSFFRKKIYFLKNYTARFGFPLIRSLIIYSKKPNPPQEACKSTFYWVTSYKNKGDKETSYIELDKDHEISRLEPKTIDPKIHWKFRKEYTSQSPKTFVAVVPEGRVWGNNGTIITPDNKLLADVTTEIGLTDINWHPIFLQLKLPPIHNMEGKAAILALLGDGGYFHWMFDVLPRIELLRKSGFPVHSIDKFIVNYSNPFQRQTLNILGITEGKVIQSNKFLHLKADKLLVPSLPGKTGNVPKWVCDFLRKEYCSNENTNNVKGSERIYISRRSARNRRITQEAELLKFLTSLGFREIILESIPVLHQVSLFRSAKVIVAPHGAGLSNIVFCEPGTKIIEFFSPNYVNVCYWALANQVQLEYYYLIGEGESPPEYVDPHSGEEDILINLDSLSNLMMLAGVL